MSFGIDNRKLKRLIDLYRPNNQAEEMKYLVTLKGEDDLFISTLPSSQIWRPVPSRVFRSTPSKTGGPPSAATSSPIKHSLFSCPSTTASHSPTSASHFFYPSSASSLKPQELATAKAASPSSWCWWQF